MRNGNMYYFAYGSNMSIARLTARVPSAVSLGCYILKQHVLKFHKSSHDGSGKCDAHFTNNEQDIIYGALYEIDPLEKPNLDKVEGLGLGYDEKTVNVIKMDEQGDKTIGAKTYFATDIDARLKPYSWYLNHVIIGANDTELPQHYVRKNIQSVIAIEDQNIQRDASERAIHD